MADMGWVKLYRKTIDDPLWANSTPPQKVVMMTLLLMANHQRREWEWQGQKFVVQPGQMVTSIESITKAAGKGISTQNVRTSLLRFEKLGFLTNQSTKTGRLITIVNWAKYQLDDGDLTKQLTMNQQRPNKDLTTNKNVKNVKNERTIYRGLSPQEEFATEIWPAYPRKQGSFAGAQEAYVQAVESGEVTKDQVLAKIAEYKAYIKLNNKQIGFITTAGKWFTGKQWLSEWDTKNPEKPKQEARTGNMATSFREPTDDDLPWK